MELASHFSTILVGGDTNASPQKLMISITVLGEGHPDHICLRRGAQAGDSLFVTGTLGDAALGLLSLQKDPAGARQSPLDPLVAKHLSPLPRIREGNLLANNHFASSLIDISDGLLIDLNRILRASKKGAIVRLEDLPLSREFKEFESSQSVDKINYALTGGEDYELLFTCSPEKKDALLQSAQEERFVITKIGTITDSEELLLLDHNEQPYPLDSLGYDHFRAIK